MIRFAFFIGLLFLTSLFMACEKNAFTQVIPIEVPEHDSALSIIAKFHENDDSLKVFLSASQSIQDTSGFRTISDPTILLFENDRIITSFINAPHALSGKTTGESKHIYMAANPGLKPDGKTTYRIEVEAPGYNSISADQYMPEPAVVSNVELIKRDPSNRSVDFPDEVHIKIQDDPEVENYYAIRVSLQFGPGENQAYFFRPIETAIGYSEIGNLYRDEDFEGQDFTLKYTLVQALPEILTEATQVKVQVSAICKDAYLFYKTKRRFEDAALNPFAEPVVIHENIEGGHGHFSLNTTSTYTIPYQ